MTPHLIPAIDAAGLFFLSGQLALGSDGRIVGDDVTAQTNVVLDRIGAVLQERGLTLRDVVKTTVWLRNADDFRMFDQAYAAKFGEHRPARSTVIAGLVFSDALIEIEAIAVPRT